MNRINQFLNALDRQNMGKVGKPMESDAELFEQLVSMACPPKPRRRRVQTAKKVE